MVCLFLISSNEIIASKPLSYGKVDDIEDIHPIHISKTTINYDTKSKTLQITAHVYIDDLETILGTRGYKNLNIGFEKESSNADEAIVKYLNEKILIKSRNSILKAEYIGKELSEDKIAVYCYFEIPLKGKPENLTILNKILHDLYNDQKNFTTYTIDNKTKGFLMFEKESIEEKLEY
jgi:hypothetical protein